MTVQITARSEQNYSQPAVLKAKLNFEFCNPIDLINRALREATLAASDLDALDIAGNALCQLVDIARAEVRHD